jgi:hypothetical protein
MFFTWRKQFHQNLTIPEIVHHFATMGRDDRAKLDESLRYCGHRTMELRSVIMHPTEHASGRIWATTPFRTGY